MNEAAGTISCPNCGGTIARGAIACKHCDAVLQQISADLSQTLVIQRPQNANPLPLDDEAFLQGTSKISNRGVIYFSIERLLTPLRRNVGEQPIIIGRTDKGRTGQLGNEDIDLSQFNAHKRGVSRRHARVYREGQSVYIEDLSSSNGTSVNGDVLEPGKRHQLHDGDEIMLGRMLMWVNF